LTNFRLFIMLGMLCQVRFKGPHGAPPVGAPRARPRGWKRRSSARRARFGKRSLGASRTGA